MARFPSKVIFDKEVREKLLTGINILADAVGSTLGPKGRNVGLNEASGPPLVLHDGVGVAKRIDLIDEFEDLRILPALAALGFGYIPGGTVTLEARPGNRRPRLARDPARQALTNSLGFPGSGSEAAVGRVRRIRESLKAGLVRRWMRELAPCGLTRHGSGSRALRFFPGGGT